MISRNASGAMLKVNLPISLSAIIVSSGRDYISDPCELQIDTGVLGCCKQLAPKKEQPGPAILTGSQTPAIRHAWKTSFSSFEVDPIVWTKFRLSLDGGAG